MTRADPSELHAATLSVLNDWRSPERGFGVLTAAGARLRLSQLCSWEHLFDTLMQ